MLTILKTTANKGVFFNFFWHEKTVLKFNDIIGQFYKIKVPFKKNYRVGNNMQF